MTRRVHSGLSENVRYTVYAVAVVAIVIAGLVYANLSTRKPVLDADGCPSHVTNNTVIVLDESEVISEQTRSEITARALHHVLEVAQVNERVTVFRIDDFSSKALKPAYSRCRPPSDGSELTESVQSIRRKFKEEFAKPLAKVMDQKPVDGKVSPIAQALIDISLSQYLRGERNSLLVYSDFLEHTPPKFSILHCSDPNAVISHFRDAHRGAQERPSFKNAAIEMSIIPRTYLSKTEIECRNKLWTWFFGDNEGEGASLTPTYLPGGT